MECSKARNFRFLEHVFLLEFTSPKIEYLRNYALKIKLKFLIIFFAQISTCEVCRLEF